MNHEVIISLSKVNDLALRLISEDDNALTDEQKQDVRTIITAARSLMNQPDIPDSNAWSFVNPAEQVKRRNELIATLRTPLNSILASCKVLKVGISEPLTNEQLQAVQTITETVQPLLDWVNHAVGYDPVVVGKTRSESQYYDFTQKLQEAITELPLDDKPISIRTEIWGDVPKAYGDPNHTKQLLTLLLANVVKHLIEGTVTTHVQIGKALTGEPTIEMTIWHSESGIVVTNENARAKLQKVSSPAHAVGYSMARTLVERQNGDLWFQGEDEIPDAICLSLPTRPIQHSLGLRRAA